MWVAPQDDVKGTRMAEEATTTDNAETTAAATGSDAGNKTTSNDSQVEKTGKTPETVPYDRFKEVNDELKSYKEKEKGKQETTQSSVSDSPEDTVLELVGKVPAELKADMSAMAKYAREHKIPVDDVISLWSTKKGLTVPKSEIDKFNQANQDAKNSGTGGTANPSVRNDNSELKSMSDDDLKARLNDLAANGQI